jgi:hypothetical protein
MNDAAARGLGVPTALGLSPPADGLAPGLLAIVSNGIEVRGDVVVWTDGARWAAAPPGRHLDLTGWECFVNSFHLEDEVPVEVVLTEENEPRISFGDQVVLLRQGVALALAVSRLATGAHPPVPVRCVVVTNHTNGTFRFHRVRRGADWVLPDLNDYGEEDMVVVVEVEPPLEASQVAVRA